MACPYGPSSPAEITAPKIYLIMRQVRRVA